jgi:hypothetical protein
VGIAIGHTPRPPIGVDKKTEGGNKVNKIIGKKVRDIVTGFEGIATGHTEWLTGCNTVGISPQELNDGKVIETHWFDENRIEVVGEGVKKQLPEPKPIKERKGGPQPTPKDGRY